MHVSQHAQVTIPMPRYVFHTAVIDRPSTGAYTQAVKLAKHLGSQRSCHTTSAFTQQKPQANHQQQSHDRLVIPIFMVSSVTGSGLPLLHAFLHALPAPLQTPPHKSPPMPDSPHHTDSSLKSANPRGPPYANSSSSSSSNGSIVDGVVTADYPENGSSVGTASDHSQSRQHAHSNQSAGDLPTHFQVDHTYEVKDVGCVVSGTVVAGTVAVGQMLKLGPQGQAGFTAVEVTCIQRSQVRCCCLLSSMSPMRHVSGYCISNAAGSNQPKA